MFQLLNLKVTINKATHKIYYNFEVEPHTKKKQEPHSYQCLSAQVFRKKDILNQINAYSVNGRYIIKSVIYTSIVILFVSYKLLPTFMTLLAL